MAIVLWTNNLLWNHKNAWWLHFVVFIGSPPPQIYINENKFRVLFLFFTEIENRYIHKTTSPQISKIPQSRKIGPYEFEWLHSNYFFKDNMPQHTCLRPLWVRAEHSMYLTARILLANLIPCSRFTGDRPWEASCPIASLFSRRSILVPTTMWLH